MNPTSEQVKDELTDVQILEKQYEKYKNKNGKKAKSLKFRIQCFKSFAELANHFYQPENKSK